MKNHVTQMPEYCENPSQSAWVMAHAGSGKTYALVKRVIALLLSNATPQSIWCLTYTNNAATEMQERLHSKLDELACLEDASLKQALAEYLGDANAGVSDAHCQKIRAIAADIMLPGQGIICTTMHGLCQKLLRIFALESGMLPDFTLLDAETQRSLLYQAIDAVFAHGLQVQKGALFEALDHVASIAKYDTVKSRLKKILSRRDLLSQALLQAGSVENLHQAVFDVCHAENGANTDDILAEIQAQTLPQMRAIYEALGEGKTQDKTKARAIKIWLDTPCDPDHLTKAWQRYLTVFYDSKSKLREKLFNKGTLVEDGALAQAFAREQMRVADALEKLSAQALAQDSSAMLSLAITALDHYHALKAKPGMLDFDDLLLSMLQLVENPVTLGHVMRKLDYRLEHILLDEAQDTSPVQWRILSHLIEEICHTAPRKSTVPRSLFVVGDVKQSIYSFQGAAPQMMQAKHAAFSALYQGHEMAFQTASLNVARRNVPLILQLVDKVANNMSVQPGLLEEGITHVPWRKNAPGMIALHPLCESEKINVPGGFHMPTAYHLGGRAQNKLAQNIAQMITDWLKNNRRYLANGQEVCASDIMIIVRNRGHLVPAIIRALEAANIPVAAIDRLVLSQHIMVLDILALIAWIYQPDDDVSLAQVLRSPMFSLSEEALFALANNRDGSLFDALCESEKHQSICLLLADFQAQKDQPIYAWLSHLFYTHELVKPYLERLGNALQEVVDALMEYAANLHGKAESHLLHFMRHMRQAEQVIKHEETTPDAVRILTVHGAKGLEAPIVILADTTSMPQMHKEEIYYTDYGDETLPLCAMQEISKQARLLKTTKEAKQKSLMHEYYRGLYVAITRARDELYIFGLKPKSASGDSWYEVIKTAMNTMDDAQEDASGILSITQKPASLHAEITAHQPSPLDGDLPDWLHARIAPEAVRITLTPSHVGALFDLDVSPADYAVFSAQKLQSNARDYGNALHAVLQWVDCNTPNQQLQKALILQALPEADIKLAMQCIAQLWNDVEIANLWQKPAQKEQPIYAQLAFNGVCYDVTGVVDRLIILPDTVMILDYKTALNIPKSDAIPVQYLAQMALYKAVLKEIYPQKNIRTALLWTHVARLDWVDEAIQKISLDEAIKNIADNLALSLDGSKDAA
jgi:ATP-dependent helicase/nuclease subunit A